MGCKIAEPCQTHLQVQSYHILRRRYVSRASSSDAAPALDPETRTVEHSWYVKSAMLVVC